MGKRRQGKKEKEKGEREKGTGNFFRKKLPVPFSLSPFS
jgi:hypothetical protein